MNRRSLSSPVERFRQTWMVAFMSLAIGVRCHGSPVQKGIVASAGVHHVSGDLGKKVGRNLFHSFDALDVSAGETWVFDAPTGRQAGVSNAGLAVRM